MKKTLYATTLVLIVSGIALYFQCNIYTVVTLNIFAGGFGAFASKLAKEYWQGNFDKGEPILHVVAICGILAVAKGFGLGIFAPAVLAGYLIQSQIYKRKLA